MYFLWANTESNGLKKCLIIQKNKMCHKEEVLFPLDPLAFFLIGSGGKRTLFFAPCLWTNRMSYVLKKCMEKRFLRKI